MRHINSLPKSSESTSNISSSDKTLRWFLRAAPALLAGMLAGCKAEQKTVKQSGNVPAQEKIKEDMQPEFTQECDPAFGACAQFPDEESEKQYRELWRMKPEDRTKEIRRMEEDIKELEEKIRTQEELEKLFEEIQQLDSPKIVA